MTTDSQIGRRRVGELPPVLGSFVTFCDTFWGCVLKLLLKLPRFYRGKEAVVCVKRAQSDSNCLFYSPQKAPIQRGERSLN